MFGRQPRLPIDVAFGLPVTNESSPSHSQYVKLLKSHLEESYQIAIQNSGKVAEKNKKRNDKVIRESTLDVRDRVLVRNLRFRTKHKLADRWESIVYVVVKKMGDLTVYMVKPETTDGPLRTLHRDHLLPCGFISPTEEEPESRPKKPQTRQSVIEIDGTNLVHEEEYEFMFPFEPELEETHFLRIGDTQTLNLDKPGSDNHLPGKETQANSYLPDMESEIAPKEGEPESESLDGEHGDNRDQNLEFPTGEGSEVRTTGRDFPPLIHDITEAAIPDLPKESHVSNEITDGTEVRNQCTD